MTTLVFPASWASWRDLFDDPTFADNVEWSEPGSYLQTRRCAVSEHQSGIAGQAKSLYHFKQGERRRFFGKGVSDVVHSHADLAGDTYYRMGADRYGWALVHEFDEVYDYPQYLEGTIHTECGGTIKDGYIAQRSDLIQWGHQQVYYFCQAEWSEYKGRATGYTIDIESGITRHYECSVSTDKPHLWEEVGMSEEKFVGNLQQILDQAWSERPELPSPNALLREACDKDAFCGNNFANVLEALSTLASVIRNVRNPMAALSAAAKEASEKGLKNFSKLWMTYRYQYSTTLADIREAMDKVDTIGQVLPTGEWDDLLGEPEIRIIRNGAARGNTKVSIMTAVTPAHALSNDMTLNVMLEHLRKMNLKMREYGFNPSLTNLWDLVPLSFVVDWFLPIGDWCEKFDERWYIDNYNFSDGIVSYKLKDTILVQGVFPVEVSVYVRNCGVTLTPVADDYTPSTKVQCKRIIDGTSMLIG